MKRRNSPRAGRPGFTLVEMMVVVTLVLLLAGLTVAFLNNFRGSSASQGTSQLYNWLSQARQRAIRDRNPYGLRLVLNPSNPGLVDQFQFIEQPEDYYIPNSTFTDICPGGGNDALYTKAGFYPANSPYFLVQFSRNLDFTGGFPKDPTLWPVQPGDYLEVNGSGRVHRIAAKAFGDQLDGVNYNARTAALGNPNGLLLVSPPDVPAGAGWQYRVIRRPRVAGEDALRLPQNVAVDLTLTAPAGYSPPAAQFDVLFGPKGQVVGPAAAYDKIVFWVRDTTGGPTDNDPNLVVINTRSGAIASYRVDTTGSDPYSETRTGQTSP